MALKKIPVEKRLRDESLEDYVVRMADYIDRLQNNVADEAKSIRDGFLPVTNVIRGVSVSTAPTAIAHGLGARPRGIIVTGRNGDVTVRKSADTNTPSLTIEVVASASAVVDLLFF